MKNRKYSKEMYFENLYLVLIIYLHALLLKGNKY